MLTFIYLRIINIILIIIRAFNIFIFMLRDNFNTKAFLYCIFLFLIFNTFF